MVQDLSPAGLGGLGRALRWLFELLFRWLVGELVGWFLSGRRVCSHARRQEGSADKKKAGSSMEACVCSLKVTVDDFISFING